MQYVRPVLCGDISYIAENMRPEDVKEVHALGHGSYSALRIGYKQSVICSTLVDPDAVPVAMLGVVPCIHYDNFGSIWLLGTPGIEKFGYRFLRYSKQVLDDYYELTGYDAFYNYTHEDNQVHHKWLKWLGFSFLRRVNNGQSGFLEFVRLKG